MKPLLYLPRLILICSAFAATGMLSACGQVGPLYMPSVPADPDAGPAAAAASQQQEQQRQQQRQRMPLPGSNTSNMPPGYMPNTPNMQNPISPQQY